MMLIEKNRLSDLMRAALDAGKTVVAPVSGDGGYSAYAAIKDPVAADLGIRTTKIPLKSYFFPVSECVMKYKVEDGKTSLVDTPLPEGECVVFGAKPCDAASLPVMDKVFSWDYKDNFYLKRRENATIVTIGCADKAAHCKCDAVGLSPSSTEGADVMLMPAAGGRYSVEAVTEKGGKLMQLWAPLLKDEKDIPAVEVLAPGEFDADALRTKLDAKFESPAWEEATLKCLGCGACAYVCPTCHCFDLVDEKSQNGGRRMKNWDACAFELFTMHGSMHNPRSIQWQRYRQRVMHKFAYYREKFGETACVGCGRCLIACPVGMDIFEVLERVSADE